MRRGRRRAQQEEDIVVESEGEASIEMEAPRPRALRDYALPDESSVQTSVARLTINANNFEISPAIFSNDPKKPIWRKCNRRSK